MPDRVKCLHVLIAHSLAKGPGVNPFGDEALAVLADEPAMAGILERESVDMRQGRRDRLRHQLDPAADRRRRSTAGCATCIARCGSSGSARASTPQDNSRPRRSPEPGRR